MFKYSFNDCMYAGIMTIGAIVVLPLVLVALPIAIIGRISLRVWEGD